MARSRKDVNVNIKTKADTSGLDKTAKALDKVEKEAKQAESRTERLARKFDQLGQSIPGSGPVSGFFRSLTSGAGKATIAIGATVAAIGGLFSLVKQGIGRVSITEDLEASFETLLGSAEAAKARIKEVTDFASETPLSIAGLATASRQLETLTGGALGAEASLRLVGDAAAVAQRPGESLDQTIQNVALHVGRLNASLSMGKGQIGESVLRMQELGLISSDTAFRLREMHQEGTRGAEAWKLLEDSLKKFSGEMDRRSKTISGRVSTLKDAWNGFTAAVARPIAPAFKRSVESMTQVLNGLSGAITGTLKFFGLVSDRAVNASDGIKKAGDSLKDISADLGAAIEKGSRMAADGLSTLEGNYDRLERKMLANIKRAEELNKLQLDLRIQEIEADDSLSPLEKAKRIGAAREAAGDKDAQLRQRAIERQMELRQGQARDFAEKISFQQDEQGRLADEIAALRKELPAELGQARQDYVTRLQRRINSLGNEQAELENLRKDSPLLFGLDDRARLRKVRRERETLRGDLLDVQRGGSMPFSERQNIEVQIARMQEALQAAKTAEQELTQRYQSEGRQREQEMQALRDALAFEKQKASIEGRLRQGNTREAVTREQRALEQADFPARAQAAEPISGALLNTAGQAQVETRRAQEAVTEAAQAMSNLSQAVNGLDGIPMVVGEINRKLNALDAQVKAQGAQIRNNRN